MKKFIFVVLLLGLFRVFPTFSKEGSPKLSPSVRSQFMKMFDEGKCIGLILRVDSIISSSDMTESDKQFALHYKVMSQLALRRYDEALSTLKFSIILPKPDSLLYWDVLAYLGMNDIYCRLNDYIDAEYVLNKAELVLKDARWKQVEPILGKNQQTSYYLAKSVLRSRQNNLPAAMTEWKKADTIGNTPSLRLIWLGQGGLLHSQLGDTIAAKELYKEALRQPVENPNKFLAAIKLAEILTDQEKYDEALALLGKYRTLAETIHDPGLQKDYLLALSVALRGVGKDSDALAYMQNAMILSDSIAKSDRTDLNGILAGKANREQLENVEKDLSKTRSLWNVTIIVFSVLIPLLCIWIFLLLRHRNKSQSRIIDLEENLKNFDNNHSAKLHDLEEQIEEHGSQLCSAAIRISRIDNGLKEIQKEIDNTAKPSDERVAAIRLNLIEMGREAKSMKRYDILLNKDSRMLGAAIKLRHPDLTKAELDLCCLIASGLANGEIADITQRSIRTVEAIKYTLRKKLNIAESTDTYIRTFASQIRNENSYSI